MMRGVARIFFLSYRTILYVCRQTLRTNHLSNVPPRTHNFPATQYISQRQKKSPAEFESVEKGEEGRGETSNIFPLPDSPLLPSPAAQNIFVGERGGRRWIWEAKETRKKKDWKGEGVRKEGEGGHTSTHTRESTLHSQNPKIARFHFS